MMRRRNIHFAVVSVLAGLLVQPVFAVVDVSQLVERESSKLDVVPTVRLLMIPTTLSTNNLLSHFRLLIYTPYEYAPQTFQLLRSPAIRDASVLLATR